MYIITNANGDLKPAETTQKLAETTWKYPETSWNPLKNLKPLVKQLKTTWNQPDYNLFY